MRPKKIVSLMDEGKIVIYRVRRLRGYLQGWAVLVFAGFEMLTDRPVITSRSVVDIQHKLDCFRFDEKPYDSPVWHVCNSSKQEKHL